MELPQCSPGTEHAPRNRTDQTQERARKRPNHPDGPGLRTAIACRACRDRKTRCSGHQPQCNYCRKAGVECAYIQGSGGFDEWGNKILGAIDELGSNLAAGNQCKPMDAFVTFRDKIEPENRDTDLSHITIESRTAVTGISSILSWNVFASDCAVLRTSFPQTHMHQSHKAEYHGQESASTAQSDLIFLTSLFISNYLPILPILYTNQLEGYIEQIGEHGIDWSAESCLVLIVAALGTVCQQDDPPQATKSGGNRTPRTSATNSSDLSTLGLRYWNMARKRLGWAFEESGLLSAQCFCLTGIWLLRNSQPVEAWKMFQSAILSINSTKLGPVFGITQRGKLVVSELDERLLQKVLEVCLRYQCKLQSELEIFSPSSTQPISFKGSEEPMLNQEVMKYPVTKKSLMFHSVDMILLQIRQGILKCFRALQTKMSWKDISNLNNELSAMQSRLENWYTNLPVDLNFPISEDPKADHTVPTDLWKAQLQNHYFEARELLCRPSLYISLHIKNIAVDQKGPKYNAFDHEMHEFFIADSRRKMFRHQALTLIRLKLLLREQTGNMFELVDGEWFKIYQCMLLSLFLIAPHRKGSGIGEVAQSTDTNWSAAVGAVANFLVSSNSSYNAKEYASLLHTLWEG